MSKLIKTVYKEIEIVEMRIRIIRKHHCTVLFQIMRDQDFNLTPKKQLQNTKKQLLLYQQSKRPNKYNSCKNESYVYFPIFEYISSSSSPV